MATQILKKASVSLAGTQFNTVVSRVEISYSADPQDETAFGDDTRIRKAGLKDWTITVEAIQDRIGGGLDAAVFSLVGNGTIACIIKADTATLSATNPLFSGVGVIQDYVPVGGAVGELDRTRLTIVAAGDLVRSTS